MKSLMRESRLSQPDYTRARGRRNALGALFSLALLIVAANPLGLVAQQQAPTLDRAELMVFARAHVAMNEARDEFHAEIASTHEEQARERARAAFDEKVALIFSEHELAQEDYERIVLIVSLDAMVRELLEEIMVELAVGGPPANNG